MSAGLPTHGREGVLRLSTATGSTVIGTEVAYSNNWTWSPSKDLVEISRLNQNSKEFLEGMVSGTFSAEGSVMPMNSQMKLLFGRFAKISTADTGGGDSSAASIVDGTMWFHGVLKPIDSNKSSDDIAGMKIMVPILASGLTFGASGSEVETWSFEGTQNGDVMFQESTSTASGIPTVS